MDWRAVLALAFNAFVVEIVGKVGNISVIRKLGAPAVSSLQAVRLVAAMFMGWLILNERLVSIWQWIGAAVVMVTVTWYVTVKKPVPE
jgi:drug/metabolite transporter (DMT)-like permease